MYFILIYFYYYPKMVFFMRQVLKPTDGNVKHFLVSFPPSKWDIQIRSSLNVNRISTIHFMLFYKGRIVLLLFISKMLSKMADFTLCLLNKTGYNG